LPEKKYLLSAQYILSELKNKYDLVDTKTIFINHLSTTNKRDYKWTQVKELLIKLSLINSKLSFIINSPPSLLENIEKQINDDEQLNKLPIKTFSATGHFYELPAMIKCCDYVISVETAIMHLAASVGTPQIALIRESARHWRPLGKGTVLFGKGRVDMISPNQIIDSFEDLAQKEILTEPSI
jgi:ADP-heptose:LPS heptosyltransferase